MKDYQKTVEAMMADSREKIIIDLRKKEEFEKDSCAGALNQHWKEFNIRNFPGADEKPVYLLCYTGETSDEFARDLRKEGYEVYSIIEGYRGYLKWKLLRKSY